MANLCHPALHEAAFKEVPLISNIVDQAEVFAETLCKQMYQNIAPCYDIAKPQYNEQFKLNIDYLKKWCVQHKINIPNGKDTDKTVKPIIDLFWRDIETRKIDQSADYYADLKQYLEKIIYLLQQNHIGITLKKDVLNDTLPQLGMCDSGIFTYFAEAVSCLTQSLQLDYILAKLRRDILLELSAAFAGRNNLHKMKDKDGKEVDTRVHVDNVFLRHAQENGINPLGGSDIKNHLNEKYGDEAWTKLTKKDIDRLLPDFHQEYQPQRIYHLLLEKWGSEFQKLVTNLNEKFTLTDGAIDLTVHSYESLKEVINSIKLKDNICFTVNELFSDHDVDISFKLKLRPLQEVILIKLLKEKIMKTISSFSTKINGEKITLSYLPTKPILPIISIRVMTAVQTYYGEEASIYFNNNELWKHTSFQQILDLNIAISKEALAFYAQREDIYEDDDNIYLHPKINAQQLLLNAINAGDHEYFELLLSMKVDTSLEVLPMMTSSQYAASINAWQFVVLIAKHVYPTPADRALFAEALLHTAKANQQANVKLLLKANAATTTCDTSSHKTALHFAAEHGNIDMVTALLIAQANVMQADKNGHIPIVSAALARKWDVVTYLIDYASNHNTPAFRQVLRLAEEANAHRVILHLQRKGVVSARPLYFYQDAVQYRELPNTVPEEKRFINDLLLEFRKQIVFGMSNPLAFATAAHLKLIPSVLPQADSTTLDEESFLTEFYQHYQLDNIVVFIADRWKSDTLISDLAKLKIQSIEDMVLYECLKHKFIFHGHIKRIKLNNASIGINYVPTNPRIPVIGKHAGQSAIQFYIRHSLWQHLTIDQLDYLQLPLTWSAFVYYREHDVTLSLREIDTAALQRSIIEAGNIDQFVMLNHFNCDLTLKLEQEKTAIHFAAEQKQWEIVRIIAGSQLAEDDEDGFSQALYLAVLAHDNETVITLLDQGAAKYGTAQTNHTPLIHLLVAENDINMLELYIAKSNFQQNLQHDLCLKDPAGLSPIALAASSAQWQILEKLVDAFQANDDGTDPAQLGLALCHAALAGRGDLVQALARKGAEANVYISPNFSPLHEAIKNNAQDLLNILLNCNLNLYMSNLDGYTPLEYAAILGHWSLVKDILRSGRVDAMHHLFQRVANLAKDDKKFSVILMLKQLNAGVHIDKLTTRRLAHFLFCGADPVEQNVQQRIHMLTNSR